MVPALSYTLFFIFSCTFACVFVFAVVYEWLRLLKEDSFNLHFKWRLHSIKDLCLSLNVNLLASCHRSRLKSFENHNAKQ